MKTTEPLNVKKRVADLFKKGTLMYVLFFYVLLILTSLILGSCTDVCETENSYTYYEPIYTSLEDLRASVAQEAPRNLEQLGKLYLKSGYLYLNEPDLGLHVIDNRDPKNPINVSFINVPGNRGLSAKGNFLYVDSYVDLVVLDISDPENIIETNRLENVFNDYNNYGYYIDPDLGLVTGWEEVRKVEITESDCVEPTYVIYDGYYFDSGIALANSEGATARVIADQGVGGSMATFTISSNFLYTLENNSDLISIDISDLANPLIHAKQNIGWGVETLFPYEDKLFMGANDGMYIYDVSQPASPEMITKYEHMRSCDPVVVQGDYAYVTLRSGNTCQGFSNQLEVINISDIANPQLEEVYPMFNPFGLGIDQDALFVCDGSAGLKIYDASDITAIGDNLKVQYGDIHALDVIPFNDVLMLIGDDGLYQYDYSDLEHITLLSEIKTTSK
jgi:hypothetical protein